MTPNPGKAMAEAWAEHRSGNYGRAEKILEEVVRTQPRAVQAIIAWGIVAASAGRAEVARERMQQALQVDSRCAPALHWLSMLSLQAGDSTEALGFAEREIAVAPKDAEGHADLARGYVSQDRFELALASYRRAIALSPYQPNLYCEQAAAFESLRRDGEAAQSLRQALRLDPRSPWMLRLADHEMREGQTEEAMKLCRRALKLNPDLAEAHMVLAEALGDARRLDEASTHWTRAGELEPNQATVAFRRAESLRLAGQFDDAIHYYQEALELDPALGRAYYPLVASRKFTEADIPLVDRMREVLAMPALPDAERINLLYALGRAHDNLGDYGAAMTCYDEANLINRTRFMKHQDFDRGQFQAFIDACIKLFTKPYVESHRQRGLLTELPLFVVGMMRSGTTLAEQILTCHREIGGAGEQPYWPDHEPELIDRQRLSVDFDRLAAGARSYVGMLSALVPGFSRVVDKNPANVYMAGAIHLALPDARILHMRRNPIDTALSIWTTPMRTSAPFISDRANIVFAYKQHLRLVEHWRSVIPADRFLDVRYEALVSDHETNIKQVVTFCGLDWDEACLHPEQNDRIVRTPSFWQVRQPIYKSSSDRWRRYEPWLGEFEELLDLD